MSFAEAVASGYRRYATFHGRARRAEFWWFHLYAALVAVVGQVIALLLWARALEGTLTGPGEEAVTNPDDIDWGWFTAAMAVLLLLAVAVLIPALAVGARRLHDAGLAAAWLLLIPVGLGIVPLVLCLLPGAEGSTRHGPDPRAARPGALSR